MDAESEKKTSYAKNGKSKICSYCLSKIYGSIQGSTTTERKPNDADWLRGAIIKIFYYPQSHLAQTFTL